MYAVLAPAKTFDLPPAPVDLEATQPALLDHTSQLIATLRGLSEKDTARLLKVKPDIARLNHERFSRFATPFTRQNAIQAAYGLAGDVYLGLQGRTLHPNDLQWAQTRLGVLSGLYGLLRPLDLMQPYRLEMGTSLRTARGGSLYAFWGALLADQIRAHTAGHRDRSLIHLASNEYIKAIPLSALWAPLVTPVFEEVAGGAAKSVVIHSKKARGLMARYIVQRRIESVDELKLFNVEGYAFAPQASDAKRLVFRRPARPASKRPR